jgi:hypothetical protein
MSHQFKPGDLAIIVGGDTVWNEGKCVELISATTGPAFVDINSGKNWVHIPAGISAWIVTGPSLVAQFTESGKKVASPEMVFAQQNLMPLRGDFTPEREKSQEVAV